MHKILVFDLDGTLAPLGKGITDADIRRLRDLEQIGYRVVICSGKPVNYLCGFMRQVELNAPVLMGENGAAFQFGVDLPPRRYATYPITQQAARQLAATRQRIDALCGAHVWYQPNEVGLTPFPKDEETFALIQEMIDASPASFSELLIYRHADSFDFTPKNINKYNGLSMLAKELEASPCDFIAIGDGVNDIPMFQFSDLSLGIGDRLKDHATHTFPDISCALHFLQTQRP